MDTISKYSMRQWINIIENVGRNDGFPISQYGYWITPKGNIQPCSSVDHAELAADQMGVPYDEDDEEQGREIVEAALSEGSVRIVAARGSQEFNAEWLEMAITSEARRSLLNLLDLYSNRDFFILQNEYFEDYKKAKQFAKTH